MGSGGGAMLKENSCFFPSANCILPVTCCFHTLCRSNLGIKKKERDTLDIILDWQFLKHVWFLASIANLKQIISINVRKFDFPKKWLVIHMN
jgi:hypothetical protein